TRVENTGYSAFFQTFSRILFHELFLACLLGSQTWTQRTAKHFAFQKIIIVMDRDTLKAAQHAQGSKSRRFLQFCRAPRQSPSRPLAFRWDARKQSPALHSRLQFQFSAQAWRILPPVARQASNREYL